MTVRADITIDIKSLSNAERELAEVRDGLPRAISGAITRTTDQVVTGVIRGIQDEVNVTRSKLYSKSTHRNDRPIRRHLLPKGEKLVTHAHIEIRGVVPAEGDVESIASTNEARRSGRIQISKGRFGFRELAPRGTFKSRPFSYQIKTKGGRQQIQGAFVPDLSKSTHSNRSDFRGGFRRMKEAGKRRTKRGRMEYPMIGLFGPSIPQVAQESRAVQYLMDTGAADILHQNLDSQIDRLLGGRRVAVG